MKHPLTSTHRSISCSGGRQTPSDAERISHRVAHRETMRTAKVELERQSRAYRASSTTDSDPNGGEACLSSLLVEASCDALVAARFLHQGRIGSAKQSLASALAELASAAAALAVL